MKLIQLNQYTKEKIMKITIDGLKELGKLTKSADKAEEVVTQYDGQTINVSKTSFFVPNNLGPDRLVVDDENSTVEDTIQFIKDNPEIDRLLQSLKNGIYQAFK